MHYVGITYESTQYKAIFINTFSYLNEIGKYAGLRKFYNKNLQSYRKKSFIKIKLY